MTDLDKSKRDENRAASDEPGKTYDFPEFAQRDWEVSQETRDHMDSVAEQQRVAEQKSGEWRFG